MPVAKRRPAAYEKKTSSSNYYISLGKKAKKNKLVN